MNAKEQFKAARRYLRKAPSIFNIAPRVDGRVMSLAARCVERVGSHVYRADWSGEGLGCQCKSCKQTNKLTRAGFDAWPKGHPAGRRVLSDYAAHVRACSAGACAPFKVGATGAGFYGVPAGLTRAKVDAVLRASFANPPADEEEVTP